MNYCYHIMLHILENFIFLPFLFHLCLLRLDTLSFCFFPMICFSVTYFHFFKFHGIVLQAWYCTMSYWINYFLYLCHFSTFNYIIIISISPFSLVSITCSISYTSFGVNSYIFIKLDILITFVSLFLLTFPTYTPTVSIDYHTQLFLL